MEHQTHSDQKYIRITKLGAWKISAIILGVVVIVLLALMFSGKTTGNVISGETAGKQLAEFLNKQTNGGVEYVSSIDKGNLYEVKVKYQNQEVPVYITKDGKYFVQNAVDLNEAPANINTNNQEAQTPSNVPKSDKPQVELFVMSHCPYGTQMEKGIIPVVKELGDKIDFKIKFVNYAMHPSQGEVEEQLNQYCIQKEFSDKYLAYLSKFLEAGNSADAFKEVGLSELSIKKCVEETDKTYSVTKNLEDKASWASGRFPKFMINDAENQKYGVQGSPTLVINGVQAESGRDAKSLLKTICSSFNNEPQECSTDMSSFGTPAPGFGFGTQGGSATSAGCGV